MLAAALRTGFRRSTLRRERRRQYKSDGDRGEACDGSTNGPRAARRLALGCGRLRGALPAARGRDDPIRGSAGGPPDRGRRSGRRGLAPGGRLARQIRATPRRRLAVDPGDRGQPVRGGAPAAREGTRGGPAARGTPISRRRRLRAARKRDRCTFGCPGAPARAPRASFERAVAELVLVPVLRGPRRRRRTAIAIAVPVPGGAEPAAAAVLSRVALRAAQQPPEPAPRPGQYLYGVFSNCLTRA
jgi:hypothetical protein